MNDNSLPEDEFVNSQHTPGGTLIEIAGHLVQVTVAFLLIFGIAIFLDQLIIYLEAKKILLHNTPILYALYVGKYAMLVSDLVLLLVLIFKLLMRAIKKL